MYCSLRGCKYSTTLCIDIKAQFQLFEHSGTVDYFPFMGPDLRPVFALSQVPSPTRLHVSNPNLSSTEPCYGETFLQTPDSPTNAARLQEDFCRLASTSEGLLFWNFSPLWSGWNLALMVLLEVMLNVVTTFLHLSLILVSPPIVHSTLLSAHKTLTAEKNQIKLVLEQQNTEVCVCVPHLLLWPTCTLHTRVLRSPPLSPLLWGSAHLALYTPYAVYMFTFIVYRLFFKDAFIQIWTKNWLKV